MNAFKRFITRFALGAGVLVVFTALAAPAAKVESSDNIKITGTVIDAETQKPIPTFTITEGRESPLPNQIEWQATGKTFETNGAFTLYLAKERFAPAVSIEAEGYIPQATGLIDEKGTNLTIALKKGSGPTGVVLNPEGNPAAGVKVHLTDMKNGVYVDSNSGVRGEIYQGTRHTVTDAQGHFSFPPQVDAYAVMIIDHEGFTEVRVSDLEKHPEVRLQPYGRIDGRLMIGNRPGSNETVRLGLANVPYEFYPRNFSPLSLFLTTTTDQDGKFQFERVPPVAIEVYHEPKVRDSQMGTIAESQTVKFLLQPGETRHLELGGKGRPIVGRFVVTNYDGKIDYRADVQSIEPVVPKPDGLPDIMAISKAFSARYQALTNEDDKKALRAEYQKQSESFSAKTRDFYQTEAGRKYSFAQGRFALNFSKDGSFRVEDVPGGKYNLKIELRESGGDAMNRFNAPVIASLTKEIEVPDSPADQLGDAMDLGSISVSARTILKRDKAAPEFAVKTLDDKPLKLSDFKGKYVLVDFWATWCGPCVAETPSLKATWDAFRNDPRFAMVGLSLDPDVAAPRNYAVKNKIDWTQGFLGEWSKSEVPTTWGVEGIPAIFLVGPDGKIIATELRGDNIKAAVAKALQK